VVSPSPGNCCIGMAAKFAVSLNPGLLVKDAGPRTRIGNIITGVDSLG
jgi:hypothetical protein